MAILVGFAIKHKTQPSLIIKH